MLAWFELNCSAEIVIFSATVALSFGIDNRFRRHDNRCCCCCSDYYPNLEFPVWRKCEHGDLVCGAVIRIVPVVVVGSVSLLLL